MTPTIPTSTSRWKRGREPVPDEGAIVPLFRRDLVIEQSPKSRAVFKVSNVQTGRSFQLYDFELSLARALDGQRRYFEVVDAGQRLGIPVTIVMPASTPTVKVSQTAGHDARVILDGAMYDDAHAKACELAEKDGYVFVHPFDDPQVIAGQGTVALEMLEAVPDLDMLVIPVGGGGLMSGVGIAARALKPRIGLIGVEAELYPSMKNVVEGLSGRIGGDTLAEGIAVKEPGELTRAIIKDKVDSIDLVAERDLEHAVALLVSVEKSVVEGAGAAGLAANLADPGRFRGRTVGTILCGGNIDTHLLANVLVRDLVRQGRIARLHVAAHDQPGALAAITAKVFEAGVNVIEINHSRIFTRLPAKDTMIEVECEARDPQSIDDVVKRLEAAGFRVERAQLD